MLYNCMPFCGSPFWARETDADLAQANWRCDDAPGASARCATSCCCPVLPPCGTSWPFPILGSRIVGLRFRAGSYCHLGLYLPKQQGPKKNIRLEGWCAESECANRLCRPTELSSYHHPRDKVAGGGGRSESLRIPAPCRSSPAILGKQQQDVANTGQ